METVGERAQQTGTKFSSLPGRRCYLLVPIQRKFSAYLGVALAIAFISTLSFIRENQSLGLDDLSVRSGTICRLSICFGFFAVTHALLVKRRDQSLILFFCCYLAAAVPSSWLTGGYD